MDLFNKCKNYTMARDAMKAGIYPYFHALESKQDIEVTMEGHRTIMIGSNNYLGLTNHPEIIKASIEAIEQFGSSVSGSRFLNGTTTMHLEFEKEIAQFLNKEAALIFSTGFQSNLAIISAIAGRNDVIMCDKDNHASIYDACRLSFAKLVRYEHSDMKDLESRLKEVPKTSGILIVTDGVFSMGGDICKLPEIVKLAKKYGARVMVDDAHGFGVLGKAGRGTAEHFGLEKEVDIIMGTFSKSLASIGGYMAASEEVVHFVKHNSRPFIFSASPTPASTASALTALRIIKREPERVAALTKIANYVRAGMKKRGIPYVDGNTPIIPVLVGTNERTFLACKMLFDKGVYVNPVISPAVPEGHSMIRTSYTATHTEKLMDEALDIMAATLKELDIVMPLEKKQ